MITPQEYDEKVAEILSLLEGPHWSLCFLAWVILFAGIVTFVVGVAWVVELVA